MHAIDILQNQGLILGVHKGVVFHQVGVLLEHEGI